ncbi:MAG: hypothetical protein IJI75_03465 [Solobacterium sp.]|nr:hypothetical protein [Solobacterium sp.]
MESFEKMYVCGYPGEGRTFDFITRNRKFAESWVLAHSTYRGFWEIEALIICQGKGRDLFKDKKVKLACAYTHNDGLVPQVAAMDKEPLIAWRSLHGFTEEDPYLVLTVPFARNQDPTVPPYYLKDDDDFEEDEF